MTAPSMLQPHVYTYDAAALRAMLCGDGYVPHRGDTVPPVEQTLVIQKVVAQVTEDGIANWFADHPAQRELPKYITGAHCGRVHRTDTTTVNFPRADHMLWTSACGAAGALTNKPDPSAAWCGACWPLDNGHKFQRGTDGITRCLVDGCGERKIDLVDPVTGWSRPCNGGNG